LSIGLYFDEHVPRAVALGLRLRGIDVITVQDDDRRGIADRSLLDRATELGRPLFTQDEDLLAEAQLRQKSGIHFSGVIYAPQPRVTIGSCVRDLHLIAEVMEPHELADRVEFLPL
jgi:predicted nuclease of predicted toxin-antitoxin system